MPNFPDRPADPLTHWNGCQLRFLIGIPSEDGGVKQDTQLMLECWCGLCLLYLYPHR